MRPFFIVAVLLTAFASNAAEPRESGAITILREHSTKTVELDSIKNRTVIRSKPPHRQLNPEGKTSEFAGVALKQLLGLSAKDADLLVSFVGVDGYISTVPASVLLKTNTILALTEDGQPLEDRRGGIQVIYPTEGADAVESRYATKAAFWCWYVRSIIVGDLSNQEKFGVVAPRKLTKSSDASVFHFEPPSVFQFNQALCPTSYRIPLSRFTRAPKVKAHLLAGNTKEITTADVDLVFSQGAKALPVHCGGPLALLDRTKPIAQPTLAKHLETNVSSIEELP